MVNLSEIWNTLNGINSEISGLYNDYKTVKTQRLTRVLPGRRSFFMTATEFEFPLVLTNTATDLFSIVPAKLPVIKPIVMSTDGVYCLSRMSHESYLELSFDYTSGVSTQHRSRRTVMVTTPYGLANYLIINPNASNHIAPCFDFEWKLEIGSNDRSYATDAIINNNQNAQGFLGRKCLGGFNDKQFEFHKPYFLDGNEFFTLTINPTLVPLSNYRLKLSLASLVGLTNVSAKFIVSMVTIGHKILGNGHRI